MTRYEVRSPTGDALLAITADRAAQAKRNLSRGVVTLWVTSDPAQGYAAMGYDPTMAGPLVFVTLSDAGVEQAREDVPEIGTTPEGLVTRRGIVPPKRSQDVEPPTPPTPTTGRPETPGPPSTVRPNG